MARVPSHIGFICEACQKPAKVRHVRRWRGECHRCQGRSWSLYVNYTEVAVERSALGTLSAVTLGFGWRTAKTLTNQTVVDGVSAEVAVSLTEMRSLVTSRVVEYVRLRERKNLRDQGGQACRVCDILYVPTADKPWTQNGCCSKSCAARDGADVLPVFEKATKERVGVPKITVVCPNGHSFEVLASFAGCLRPCTDCGEKTRVP